MFWQLICTHRTQAQIACLVAFESQNQSWVWKAIHVEHKGINLLDVIIKKFLKCEYFPKHCAISKYQNIENQCTKYVMNTLWINDLNKLFNKQSSLEWSEIHIMIMRPSYHHNYNSYVGKMVYLFWTLANEIRLTDCGLVTPYGDRDLGQHWLR